LTFVRIRGCVSIAATKLIHSRVVGFSVLAGVVIDPGRVTYYEYNITIIRFQDSVF